MTGNSGRARMDTQSLTDIDTYVYETIATLEYTGRPATRSQIAGVTDVDDQALDESLGTEHIAWEPEPDLLTADTVTIAVQVMGKLRGTVTALPDAPRDDVLAAAKTETNVARALEGKRIVKQIYVPNRIVNFVVAG